MSSLCPLRPKFSDSDRKRRRNEIFIIVFLFLIVTLFSICWIPLMVSLYVLLLLNKLKVESMFLARFIKINGIFSSWAINMYSLISSLKMSVCNLYLYYFCVKHLRSFPSSEKMTIQCIPIYLTCRGVFKGVFEDVSK